MADDNLDLMAKLKVKGLFVTSYQQIEEKQKKASYKFKTKDLSFICRQLSSMLSSGISIVKSLHILVTQQEKAKPKQVLMDIYEDVQKGRSFSEAVAAKGDCFPNLFVSMVAAGEASGNLDVIMTRVSEYYAKQNRIDNKVKGAMTYPIILGILMIGIVLALFAFIMPTFRNLFTNPDDIPALSKMLFNISDFILEKWYILIIVVIALIFAIRICLKTDVTRLKIDELIIKMPKVGKLVGTIYTARFARTMSNLFASGMQMVDCIEKSVSTLGNSYVQKEFVEVVESVKQGESLSNSIAKTGVFDGIFVSTIYVGEEAGTLDEILSKSADYYDEESDAAITKLVGMLEPLMIIILGIAVMLVLAGIFPALYGSFSNIT